MRAFLLALAAVFSLTFGPLAPAPAAAQLSSAAADGGLLTPEETAAFSKQVERDLAARGARVAIVFRTGRPREELPEGIAYTHGAFWVHRVIATENGAATSGYAVYNLYAGGYDGDWAPTESRLVQDWPFDFTKGAKVDDVAVIIPSPEMQRRLLGLIDSPTYAALHNPHYTLVANPLEARYQNCNSFMLDVIAAAAWQTSEPQQIRANLRAWFKPAVVQANGLLRLFGPIFDERLKTDDHSGPIRTATYGSIAAFMAEHGLLQETYVLNFDG
jgi:hypothetical protein